MAKINVTKYNAQVANAASQVKISSTVFKDFIGDVKTVVDANDDELIAHKTAAVLDHPDLSVTTAKLANGSVTAAKVAADVATQAELDTVSTVANAALPASSYTAADVLAKLLTVDGSGSGINADFLDSLDVSSLVKQGSIAIASGDISAYSFATGIYSVQPAVTNMPRAGEYWSILANISDANTADLIAFGRSATASIFYRNKTNTTWQAWTPIWHLGNDGAGSGLDADKISGKALTVSTTAPTSPAVNDIWIQI